MQNVPYLDLNKTKSKNIKENLAVQSNISVYSLQIRGKKQSLAFNA